jgi:hypothetical protein
MISHKLHANKGWARLLQVQIPKGFKTSFTEQL